MISINQSKSKRATKYGPALFNVLGEIAKAAGRLPLSDDPVLTSRTAIHSARGDLCRPVRSGAWEGEMKGKRQRQTQLAPLHDLRFSSDRR